MAGKAQVICNRINYERHLKGIGSIESEWEWYFNCMNGGIQLKWVIGYTIPIPVLGKVGELLIMRCNERVARFVIYQREVGSLTME